MALLTGTEILKDSVYFELKFRPLSIERWISSRILVRLLQNCSPAGVSAAPYPER